VPIDRTEKNYPDASAYGFQVRARRSIDFPYDVVYLVLSLVFGFVFSFQYVPFSKSNRTKRTTSHSYRSRARRDATADRSD
jgi:hypothetical protein